MSRGASGRVISSDVHRIAQQLIRAYTPVRVVVSRDTPSYDNDYGENKPTITQIYAGEARLKLTTGTVNRFGLGQVENTSYIVLISGKRNIQQGDFLTWEGFRFQVTKDVKLFGAFTIFEIQQFSQKT